MANKRVNQLPTNTLYIGAEEVTTDLFQLTIRGNKALLKRNTSDGLV